MAARAFADVSPGRRFTFSWTTASVRLSVSTTPTVRPNLLPSRCVEDGNPSCPSTPYSVSSSCSAVVVIHTHTHTHTFNGPFSPTTQVGRYQKGKTNLDFTEARDSEWHWNQLGHMQVCTSLQTDNHASTSPLSFYRPDALSATQPTASKHRRPVTVVVVVWKPELPIYAVQCECLTYM